MIFPFHSLSMVNRAIRPSSSSSSLVHLHLIVLARNENLLLFYVFRIIEGIIFDRCNQDVHEFAFLVFFGFSRKERLSDVSFVDK